MKEACEYHKSHFKHGDLKELHAFRKVSEEASTDKHADVWGLGPHVSNGSQWFLEVQKDNRESEEASETGGPQTFACVMSP
jgi:hypothetical protein